LLQKIGKISTIEEARVLCEKANLDAKVMVRIMLNECYYKKNDDRLKQWKHKIRTELQ
jgi:hypothetical protein